jgi:Dockerin type I domain
VFGNNGSVNYGGNVTSGSNTALSDLSNRTTILSDLTTATDHLPVVADYTIVPPGDFNRDGSVNAADIGAMMSALMNIPSYESSTGLNAQQLLEIGDVNGDGVMNNADIQALIDLVANNTVVGGGSISNGSLAAVPEPASLSLFLGGGWVFLLIQRRRYHASPLV